jgi:S-adenosylmethionine synthetase
MSQRKDFLFTSESVGEGHPDKVCDQISDAILDDAIRQDPDSRVGCETFTTTGLVLCGGEITTKGTLDVQRIVRGVLKSIGYTEAVYGIDYESCSVLTAIHSQSVDISQGVTAGQGLHKEQGAGDQGMMFGYATNENSHFMPAPLYFSHQIMQKAAEVRKKGILPFLRPDGKCQVTVKYVDGKPEAITTIVLSHQHDEDVTYEQLEEGMIEEIIRKALPADMLKGNVVYHINPTGRFVIGGPHGDSGLTGRKIIVDTYGGMASHGGGAFSGKDPSKVDRSAAYMARYIAKNLVAAGVCERCEVELAYAIGVAEPVSVYVTTYGTGTVADAKLESIIRKVFELKPAGIITALDLKKPIYQKTASYGHFGRDIFSWEKTDKVEAIKAAL